MNARKKLSFWEKFAIKELSRVSKIQEGNDLFLLSEEEINTLRKIRINTFLKVGLAGVLGVVLLYVPYHIFGASLFPETQVWIPFYEEYVPLEIEFLVYSLILVLFEIWYLTYANVKAVSQIAHACGHPNPNDPEFEENINTLMAVSLEKKQNQLESIGINPYRGLHPWGVFVFQIILRLKATVSGFLFKVFVKKALGRYALRAFIDFAGIPVYAFWNIWGARKIMNEARIRVMAPPLVKRCVELIYKQQKDNPEFKEYLYDTLQLISESKRSFHDNHFLLSVALLEKFEVELNANPPYNDDFLAEVSELSSKTRDGVQQLLIFGMMIDGSLSRREKKAVRYLIDKNVIQYSEAEILKWSKDYFDGRGIERFFGT